MKLSIYLKDSKIKYADKITKASKELPIIFLQHWSVDCAESVLHIFEKEYPKDLRVRECINTTRLVLAGKLPTNSANTAAYAAYDTANAAYATAYADTHATNSAANVAYAAAYAANAATHATNSAAYAVYAATNAVNAAAYAEKEQEEINIQLLLKQVEIFESPLYNSMQESS